MKHTVAPRVRITIQIDAKDEVTVRRIMEHPAFITFASALKSLGTEGHVATRSFQQYTLKDYRESESLRADALTWLFKQLLLPMDHADRVMILDHIQSPRQLRASHVRFGLPELYEYFKSVVKERIGADSSRSVTKETNQLVHEFICTTLGVSK
ncbi:MAG: hypothetical protein Q7S22_04000 [Candidatus Micrarchaeota archaeon]|nr:hypothetical protein [Candidatus Micrarchaeota archaeon]